MPGHEVELLNLDAGRLRGLRVVRDDNDAHDRPLGINTGEEWNTIWLSPDEARQVADLLYAELGLPTEPEFVKVGGYIEGLLRLAADHDRVVTFGYAKGNGDYIETRRLIPGQVQTTKQGHTIVVGHDPDRDDVRAYRLDKIKGQVSI